MMQKSLKDRNIKIAQKGEIGIKEPLIFHNILLILQAHPDDSNFFDNVHENSTVLCVF